MHSGEIWVGDTISLFLGMKPQEGLSEGVEEVEWEGLAGRVHRDESPAGNLRNTHP